jgi:hypothetical protein
MTIEEQQSIATELINKLRAIDPYVIVAGGAPRDWHFGDEAKDLDLYLHLSGKTNTFRERQLKAAIGDVVTKWTKRGDYNDDLYRTMKFLHSIYELEYKGIKVQIMSLLDEGDTFKVVDAMSCSICKAWWTPERGVVREQDFKLTEKTNTIFLSDGYAWQDPHPTKIKERFTGKYRFANSKDQVIKQLLNDL